MRSLTSVSGLTLAVLFTLLSIQAQVSTPPPETCYNKPCQRVGDDDNCNCVTFACYPTGPGLPGACKCDTDLSVEHPDFPQRCVPLADEIGDSCFELPNHNLCRNVINTVCNGSHCVCIPESHFDYTFPNNRLRTCIPYSHSLGDWCFLPQQCDLIPGGECDFVYKNCTCDSAHYQSQFGIKQCLRYAVELYDNCTEAKQCERLENTVVCSRGVCVCPPDDHFHHQPSPPYCLPFLKEIGSDCRQGSRQCERIQGAECPFDSGKCACDSNHALHPNKGECVHLICSTCLGDRCMVGAVPEQCSLIPGSHCHPNSLTCACREGFYQNGTLCSPYATFPGGPCLDDHQCASIPGTRCVANTCTCQDHLDVSFDSSRCFVRPTQVGGRCESTFNCRNILNTDCSGGGCNCVAEHVSSSDRTRCLPTIPKLGGGCEETVQCSIGIGNNALCLQGFCRCLPGYVEQIGEGTDRDTCLSLAQRPGDPCLEEEQCNGIPGTTCSGGECTCQPNFDVSFDERGCFLRPIQVAGQCESNFNCRNILNTDCSGGGCKCIAEHVSSSDRSRCLPMIPKLGAGCEETIQCSVGIGNNALCLQGFCRCLPGYVEQIGEGTDPDTCLPFAQKPGDLCLEEEQCSGIPGTTCAGNQCTCQPHFDVSFDGRGCFLRPIQVAGQCESNFNCRNILNTDCSGGGCNCVAGNISSSDRSKCLPIISKLGTLPCEESAQCSTGMGANSLCTGGVCKCQGGYVEWAGEGTVPDECLPTSQHEDPCRVHAQCTLPLGPEAECSSEGLCGCKSGAGFLNSGCHPRRLLHEVCSSLEECILGSNNWAGCRTHPTLNTTCQCLPGSVETPGRFVCLPDRRVGSPCETDEECKASINGTVLCNDDGRCACGFTSRPNEDMSACNGGASSVLFKFGLVMAIVLGLVKCNTYI